MAQSTFSVRMDEELKEQFDMLCQDFGMNMTTAINVFARAVVREKKIPFEISSPKSHYTRDGALLAIEMLRKQARDNGLTEMTLDEINDEINKSRKGLPE